MKNAEMKEENKEKDERLRGTSSGSMNHRCSEGKENSKEVVFTVLQKNASSLSSTERIEEMFSEVQG